MNKHLRLFTFLTLLFLCNVNSVIAQSTTGSISGTIVDETQSVIPNATVTARNVERGVTRTSQTNNEGRYSLVNLPVGLYEVSVEAPNFTKYVQTGITLLVNQNAEVDATLKAGGVQEVVTVSENASVLNTTTAEVATRFDEKRLSELPIAPNRNVYNVLLSVPGVSQLSSGQSGFAQGISFSVNGGRVRSNNFMLDGQDINDPSLSGPQIPINNPDAIGEVRIITNQFLAEYGRNSGSVVNFVSKSGTNDFRGSLFWFHNNEYLNACSNLDKNAGFCNPNATDPARRRAPRRLENQVGFSFGGPLTFLNFGEGGPMVWSGKDRTFFFGDYQRWANRQLGSGFTLSGAPTEAGRAVLQQFATRPQVAALLRFVPAGTPNGQTRSFTVGGQTFTVPLGNLTGSSSNVFDDHQGSIRIDHRFSEKNLLYGRYRFSRQAQSGTGQVTPPGLTNLVKVDTDSATIVLNSVLTSKLANELRVGWTRFDSSTNAEDPAAESIPSIEITGLGLVGFNSAVSRTALGLAVNLPQFRINDTYQIQEALSYTTGNHNMKFGAEIRRTDVKSFFFPTIRGLLRYATLQDFINDTAEAAQINLPLRGGEPIGFYRWYEYYAYAQDQWRITPNFTLTLGLRYEYPGNSFSYLQDLNQRILATNGNDQRYGLTPVPQADKNNFMPRIGFNWNPRTSDNGVLGFITGGDKLVLRGGYSRTYDANFININLNIASSFPFTATQNIPLTNSFATLSATTVPNVSNPNLLIRTVVAEDFRSPSMDQLSVEVQRELTRDMVMRVGYIHTRGRGLFQTIDANPRSLCTGGTFANPCPRVDPTRGVIRLRGNRASSDYNALQVSFDKRLTRGFSAGFHYTYSSFIDTASEVFNPSNAEVALAQNSFNLEAERARSSFDRPHRFTGNFVYELPFYSEQRGFLGRVLGGFQVNSFFTFQSGAPFTVLNGADPAGALTGISNLVGNAIRPNLNTTLSLSSLSIPEILSQCGTPVAGNNCPALFTAVTAGQRFGNLGRNILRAQAISLVDFGIIKNTRVAENVRVQFRADFFNALNHRNFGVPNGAINNPNFLNQWATNGGNRRVVLGARLVF